MEFSTSKRGGRVVLYNGFKYNFSSTKKKDETSRWRCVTRTCKAKLCTDKKDSFISTFGEHNHDAHGKSNTNCQTVKKTCQRVNIGEKVYHFFHIHFLGFIS